MSDGRRRGDWSRTLSLLVPLCVVANSKLRKGAKPMQAADFNPFRPPRVRERVTAREMAERCVPPKKRPRV